MDQKKLAVVAAVLVAVALFLAFGGTDLLSGSKKEDGAGRNVARQPQPPAKAPAPKAEQPKQPPAKAPPTKAQPAPVETPAKSPADEVELPIEKPEIDWYGIYMEGGKVGWVLMEYEPITRAGKTFLRSHFLMDVRMKALGEVKHMRIEEEMLYSTTPPHRVVTGWNVQRQGAFSQRVQLQGKPGAFKALITAGGQTRKLALEEDPTTFLEAMKPFHWFREPRKVGQKLTWRSFDLSELEHDDDTLEVTSVEKAIVDGVPMTYYVAQYSTKRDGEMGTFRVDGKGTLLSMQMMGGVMEIRLEPEEVAKQPGKQVDIFVSRIARIDKPLGQPRDVVEMVVEVRGQGIDRIQDGPRQRALYDEKRQVLTLKLGAQFDPKVKATEEEIRESLAEDPDHPIRDRRIVKLAKRAIGDATTPRQKVERLVAFVDKYVDDSYAAEPLSVIDILDVRKGDCTEHSLLFSVLARAVGVPARQVGGLAYMGDEIRIRGAYGFGGHAWNEVVLDGIWVPVDATWGQTEIDATHIRQAAENQNEGANFTLGGAKLKLVRIKKR